MEFEYIKNYYKVPADMFREVTVGGEKGVITKDMGNYIGVTFYDRKDKNAIALSSNFGSCLFRNLQLQAT